MKNITESGLDHMKARHFASSLGRFPQPDSFAFSDLGNPQSLNLYAYVLNNPLRYIDPTGHAANASGSVSWGPPATATGPWPERSGGTVATDPWSLYFMFAVFGYVGGSRVSYRVTILGQSVLVDIYGASEEEVDIIRGKIREAAKTINNGAPRLSPGEISVIRNINVIRVSPEYNRLGVGIESSTGVMLVGTYALTMGSWGYTGRQFALLIAHEAWHWKDIWERGPIFAGSEEGQRRAIRFEIRVGEKLGFTKDELARWRELLRNPGAAARDIWEVK